MTDPQTNKKIIRINPELSEELLQEAIIETRAIIINLYLTCETDFANGIKIYEAIVDKKIIETAKSQIQTMENNREKLVTDEEIPKPAELRELKEIADRKIQKQKEKIANEETKIQKEQEKIDIVSPVIQEPVQAVASKEVKEAPVEVKEAPVEAKEEPVEVKEAPVAPVVPQVKVKINVQGQAAGSRKYKQKSKCKKTRGKRVKR